MDPIQMEKLWNAKKRHSGRNTFLRRFVRLFLSLLFLVLFLSSPLWLPNVVYSVKFLLYVLLPRILAFVLGPKCLFFICNAIIVFLLGESKRSCSVSSTRDVYEEYVEKSRSMRERMEYSKEISMEASEQEDKPGVLPSHSHVAASYDLQSVPVLPGSDHHKDEEEVEGHEAEEAAAAEEEEEEDTAGDEEEDDVDGDELNKRVEDFIARINAQRKLEARMLICTHSREEEDGGWRMQG